MLSAIFEPFVKESPLSVVARVMIERALNPEQIDEWFEATAKQQYTRDFRNFLGAMVSRWWWYLGNIEVTGRYEARHEVNLRNRQVL
jgi:hypothetical protein